jgi:hypothetical protein
MNRHLITYCCGFLLLLWSSSFLHADSESGNWPFVAAATTDGTTWHGGYYAKCVPTSIFGTDGETRIYRVEKDQDVLVHTYDWYSPRIYLSGVVKKVSVVRFGCWNRGYRANTNDLALAFYYDGKLLKWYSTLDIAGRADNVQPSTSHYTWCGKVAGYGHIARSYGFTIETIDGRTLCFDVRTGELVNESKP